MIRILAAALCLAFAAPSFAATAQQERMKTCNEKATGMKGEQRKEFMSKCLKGGGERATTTTPQERMKECNKRAEGKKGDERKVFMKLCLKAS